MVNDAGPADAARLGRIIARAFHDDPVNLWVFGGEAAMRAAFTALARRTYLPRGFAHLDTGERGAALWLPPGQSKDGRLLDLLHIAAAIVGSGGPGALRRGLALDAAFTRAHPDGPHAYLFAVGVVPEAQGKGVGGALMRAGLARADALGVPAYLESTKESNLPLYRHFGFVEREPMVLPAGCPPVWPMWRAARGH